MAAAKIAVVEDNEDNRLVVRALLEESYQIEEFESGDAALVAFDTAQPDLVLLDISLPGMDGREVLRRMRAEPKTAGLPVIALTAHAMSGDREKFLAAGFDEYLTKPIVDDAQLHRAIADLLSRRATDPAISG